MPTNETKFELGSNLAGGIGFIGMNELRADLQKIRDNVSGKNLRDALMAGAEVFKSAIEAATPTAKIAGPRVKPGQAKSHVIIYERKKRGALMSTSDDLSLMVGYAKKYGYYMYWYEHGRKGFDIRAGQGKIKKAKAIHYMSSGKDVFVRSAHVGPQPERKFMQGVFNSSKGAALDAVKAVLANKLKKGIM